MSFWNTTVWWARMNRYSPSTWGECNGLNTLICNLFIMSPNVGLGRSHYWSKTKKKSVRHSNFVLPIWGICTSSKWERSWGLRLTDVYEQRKETQEIRCMRIASIYSKSGKQNKRVPLNQAKWHLCTSIVKPQLVWVTTAVNGPLFSVWGGLCSKQYLRTLDMQV